MKIYPSHLNLFARKSGLTCLVIGLFIFNSCVTNKKTTYFQEYKKSEYSPEYVIPETYQIQPSDNLFIRVTTPDPQWSAMFNTVSPVSTSVGNSEQSVDLISYSVSHDGTVEIPFLGAIYVAGKTLQEAKLELEKALSDYVNDAAITVKLVNNYVNILGEVNRPGQYPIYKEHLTIFQAMALAGDMTRFANRHSVSIIRHTADGTIVKEFDLTDKKILDTEFYYVMPNDLIYAKSMKGRFFAFDEFPYLMILSTVTTFLLILNYIQ